MQPAARHERECWKGQGRPCRGREWEDGRGRTRSSCSLPRRCISRRSCALEFLASAPSWSEPASARNWSTSMAALRSSAAVAMVGRVVDGRAAAAAAAAQLAVAPGGKELSLGLIQSVETIMGGQGTGQRRREQKSQSGRAFSRPGTSPRGRDPSLFVPTYGPVPKLDYGMRPMSCRAAARREAGLPWCRPACMASGPRPTGTLGRAGAGGERAWALTFLIPTSRAHERGGGDGTSRVPGLMLGCARVRMCTSSWPDGWACGRPPVR